MTRRALVLAATVGAVALSTALGAATLAAEPSPVPSTLGARVVPNALRLDDGRTLTVYSLAGGLVERFTLTTDDPAYTVEPATFTLPAGGSQVVTLATVGQADAMLTIRAEAIDATSAGVTSAIVLDVALRWASPLEKIARTLGPYAAFAVLIAAALAVLVVTVATRRKDTAP